MSSRLLAFVFIALWCRPVLAMDLMDLYREAKANDARYAAAKAQFRVMQERVPLAKAGVVPAAGLRAGDQTVGGSVGGALTPSDSQQSIYNARDDSSARTGSDLGIRPVWPQY